MLFFCTCQLFTSCLLASCLDSGLVEICVFQYLHKPIAKAFSHNKMLAGPSELWIMSASIDIMALDSSIIIISHV